MCQDSIEYVEHMHVRFIVFWLESLDLFKKMIGEKHFGNTN